MYDDKNSAINNPPAFPRPASIGNNYATGEEGVVVDPQMGMSLRDYLAAKAFGGFCANPSIFAANAVNGWSLVNTTPADLASYAYHLADAMLAERRAK